jgi:hypothetical protein
VQQQVERQKATQAKALRRKQLITGGVVAFMAVALLAPLTAGLIGSSNNSSAIPSTIPPTSSVPVSIPWVQGDAVGAELTGATPCPATDGTAERTTQFAEAPPVCIDSAATYELTFDTAAGAFTLPIDPKLNESVANLAAVFGWYGTYEQTPVQALEGLIWVGSPGDAGFTIPLSEPVGEFGERYLVGSVLAIPSIEGGLAGALMVVMEEIGSATLELDPRYTLVGMVDDLSEVQAVYEAPQANEILVVDTVSVATAS